MAKLRILRSPRPGGHDMVGRVLELKSGIEYGKILSTTKNQLPSLIQSAKHTLPKIRDTNPPPFY